LGEELDLWDELDDLVFPISSFSPSISVSSTFGKSPKISFENPWISRSDSEMIFLEDLNDL